MNLNPVAIVIPIYKTSLKDYELMSLQQCYKILNNFPIVFVKPESLSLSSYKSLVDSNNWHIESFDNDYFKDIQGYNRLLLSESFYARFLKYEYILIYQLDAFIFKDELQYWCKQGYDYIGAPWVQRYKFKRKIRSLIHYKLNRKQRNGVLPTSLQFYNRVGNGGFSLRKVEKFYELCKTQKLLIDYYNQNEHNFYNEDVFWSLEVNRKKKQLYIPHYRKALHFSIEQDPALAMRLNEGNLPFGAHALYAFSEFWRPYVKEAGYDFF